MLLLLLMLSLLASAQAVPEDKGSSPSVLQYVLEAVVGLPDWSQYLPDDIDVDQDGNLNEKEVEIKFKSYVKDVFDQLDKNADKLVTQEEFRNASINLIGINKIIDIAMQAFPIKTILGFGDRNRDGFISEDDFLIPENNRKKLLHEYYKETFGDDYYKSWNLVRKQRVSGTNWTIGVENVPGFKETRWNDPLLMCSKNFGQKEAQVLCREKGYPGVHSVSSIRTYDYLRMSGKNDATVYGDKFVCQGTESSLEECQKFKDNDIISDNRGGKCPHDNNGWTNKELLASVHCALSKDNIGKVELVGGKDGSSGDLHIGLEKYCDDISPEVAKVVCTELGFVTGTPLVTRNNYFTDVTGPPNIERRFECNGTEQTLQDCQPVQSTKIFDRYRKPKYRKDPMNKKRAVALHCSGKSNGIICRPGEPLWKKYGKPPGEWSEDTADYNDGERGFYHIWEKFARYLLIADTNEDHKASMEELGTKLKDIVASAFHVLDQTHDGVFSKADLMTLNVRQPDFLGLVRKLFQILAKGGQQIDLYMLNVPGLDGPLGNYDYNQDKIINLKDFRLDSSRMEGLVTILIKQVDPNQDGIITATELDNYVKAIFNHLGGGTVTLDSIWKLLRESQFTCLQIHGIQTFVEALKDTIDTQTKKLLDYFFGELDLNDNGEIPLEELYNAHVPCDEVNPYRTPFGILTYMTRNPADLDGYRIGCYRLLDGYSHMSPQAPSLGPPIRGEPLGHFEEKLANAACIAMQPDF